MVHMAYHDAIGCGIKTGRKPIVQRLWLIFGQRDPDATRIYAKVDLVRLREVASFDLGELL